jgi:hypothetical protein
MQALGVRLGIRDGDYPARVLAAAYPCIRSRRRPCDRLAHLQNRGLDKAERNHITANATEGDAVAHEIAIPISYGGDRARAEQILLESTGRHTDPIRERGVN